MINTDFTYWKSIDHCLMNIMQLCVNKGKAFQKFLTCIIFILLFTIVSGQMITRSSQLFIINLFSPAIIICLVTCWKKYYDRLKIVVIKGFTTLSNYFVLPQISIVRLEFNDKLYYVFDCSNSVYSNGTTS